ncbi:MAG: aminoacyl-tRNA hydrolase [Chitinophagaceae bacterium]|nr:aminoacyl-tRNA hydrolase [Chitinophagaceae bacterium]
MSKFLIAGLGNIGPEYEGTRHNIGFDVLDAFVAKHEGVYRTERLAFRSEVKYKGRFFLCIKPTTFMNLSGKSVKYWMDKEHVSTDHILIIVDDLAIPLERIRVRGTGTDAGHNGLKSIQEMLGTDKYPKLRFGIGNDFPKGSQVEYVLGKWNPHELPLIQHKKEKCVEVIESFANIGIERTMSQFNNLSFQL